MKGVLFQDLWEALNKEKHKKIHFDTLEEKWQCYKGALKEGFITTSIFDIRSQG